MRGFSTWRQRALFLSGAFLCFSLVADPLPTGESRRRLGELPVRVTSMRLDQDEVTLDQAAVALQTTAPPGIPAALWETIRAQEGIVTIEQYKQLKRAAQTAAIAENVDATPAPGPTPERPSPSVSPPASAQASPSVSPDPASPTRVAGSPSPSPVLSAIDGDGNGTPSQPDRPISNAARDPLSQALNRLEDGEPSPPPSAEAGPSPAETGSIRVGHDAPVVEPPFPVARFFRREPTVTPSAPVVGVERWQRKQNDQVNRAVDEVQQALQDPEATDQEIAQRMENLLRLGKESGILEEGDSRLADVTKIVVNLIAAPTSLDSPSGSSASADPGKNPPPLTEPDVTGSGSLTGGENAGGPSDKAGGSDRRPGGRLSTELSDIQPWLLPPKNRPTGTMAVPTGARGLASSEAKTPEARSDLRRASHGLIRDLAATLQAQKRMGMGKSRAAQARRALASVSPVLSGFAFPGNPDDPSLWPFLGTLVLLSAGAWWGLLRWRTRKRTRPIPAKR